MKNITYAALLAWCSFILLLFTFQVTLAQTLKVTKNASPPDDTPFEFNLKKMTPPEFIMTWGTVGSNNGQFNFPTGIATDQMGNVYVADLLNNRIQKFDSNGNFLLKWGITGSGNGQFSGPTDITIDKNGNVFVADLFNSRIQKFDSNGNFISKWGTPGNGNGQFASPVGVATDHLGNVFVVDEANNRIQKFDNNGNYLLKWGTGGSGNGQFNSSYGIAVDATGNVYVTEQENHRVQKFDNNGNYLTQWGTFGPGIGQLRFPAGIAIDKFNNIYVAESGGSRVQQFDNEGNYIGQWGSLGIADGEFYLILDVAISENGSTYFYTVDQNRVQKFGLPCFNFTLNDPSNNMLFFDMFTTGSYKLSESQLNGWNLVDIQITGDINNNSIITIDSATIIINLDLDENIEVIFNNCVLPTIESITPQTICSAKKLSLASLKSIINYPDSNLLEYTWTIRESGNNGNFTGMDSSNPFVGFYTPDTEAIERGYVTLILTIDNPNDACQPVTESVIITLLNTNCGNFPWSGN